MAAERPAQGGIQILGTATVLFLYASTDIVTDSDGVSQTAPIYEGYMKIPIERRCCFTAAAEREIAGDVIENRCNVGLDHDTEQKTLWAPIIITRGAKRFHCAEMFFPAKFPW